MKPKPRLAAPTLNPINLVIPNTTKEKMEAIVNLSQAVLELSKALNSVNLKATIQNNIIQTGGGVGINVAMDNTSCP